MKKGLSALVFALIVMATLVSNVAAAPARLNKAATLKSVRYERSGIVLLFDVSGFSKNDLKNISFTAHSGQWNMVCNFVDDTTHVRCLVSKKLSMFAGERFHGTLAGIYFAGQIPNARVFPITVVTKAPVFSETLVMSDIFIEANTLVAAETSTGCPAGQTLVYDFHWSGTAHSDGYITSSTTYYDADTFHAAYGSYYDYVSTAYNSENVLYYTYHRQNTYTFTSSGSINPAQWDWYVQHMSGLGYTVEQTGEHCDYSP